MPAYPQLWTKRLALCIDGRSVTLPFPSDDPPQSTIEWSDTPQLCAGTLKNFRVDLDSASTDDWTFDIVKNGSVELSVTITGGTTTATDTGSFTFDVLDLLRIDQTRAGTATSKPWTFTAEFVPDVAGERAYGGGPFAFFGDAGDPALIYKQNPLFPRTTTWLDMTLDTTKTENCAIGQDGTITNFLIYYQIELVDGSYEFALYKCPAASDPSNLANYVKQDGGGGTVDTRTTLDGSSPTLADSATTVRSYCLGSFSLPVDQGDFVFITAERITGTTFPVDDVGLRGLVTLKFVADDTATWFISGADDALGPFNTNYFAPLGDRVTVDTTAANVQINHGPLGLTGAIYKGLIVWLETAPGSGNSRDFALFNNGSTSDIVVSVSGTSKTASDNGSATITPGDDVVVQHIPVSIPDDDVRFWFTFFGTSTNPSAATAFAQWR